jgi:hypothetical protein
MKCLAFLAVLAATACAGSTPRSAPQVRGRIEPSLIQGVVRSHFGRFRICYERTLASDPKADGRIAIKFQIGLDGHVNDASVVERDTFGDEFVQCILDGFQKLVFPQPKGGVVVVVYPIVFHPSPVAEAPADAGARE